MVFYYIGYIAGTFALAVGFALRYTAGSILFGLIQSVYILKCSDEDFYRVEPGHGLCRGIYGMFSMISFFLTVALVIGLTVPLIVFPCTYADTLQQRWFEEELKKRGYSLPTDPVSSHTGTTVLSGKSSPKPKANAQKRH